MNISLEGLSVCIGIPTTRGFHPLVVKSLIATQRICYVHNIPCEFAVIANNAVIQWARDEVVESFLSTSMQRLFWIDSDIVWEPEDFMRLLALSQKRDIVCASYPAKKDEILTFYIRYDTTKPLETDDCGLVEIKGAGLGFTVISRSAIEKVVANSETVYDEITKRFLPSVFQVGRIGRNRRGEDMSFFEKLTDLGYKINLDPSIRLGHIGDKTYYGRVMDAMEFSCT